MPNPNSAVVRPTSARRRGLFGWMTKSDKARGIGAFKSRGSVIEILEHRQLLSVSHDAGGWTVVTPGASTRVVYVSSSGGSDGNSGLSSTAPVKSIARAKTLLRSGTGDQLLLKAGDTWYEPLGAWNLSGQSAAQPLVVGSYGSGARPTLITGTQNGLIAGVKGTVHDVAIIGIHLSAAGRGGAMPDGITVSGGLSGLLVEDCLFEQYRNNITLQAFFSPIYNITVRRSVIVDAYASGSHAQGIYADGVVGLTLQDNVFDHNGWGHGAAQTTMNHDVYVTALSSGLTATGNIFANASNYGLQARPGGTVTGNLFLNDAVGLSFGLVNGSGVVKPGGVTGVISDNAFVGGHSVNGLAAGVGVDLSNIASASVVNNLFAWGDPTARNAAININTISGTQNPQQAVGVHNLNVSNNVVYHWSQAVSVSNLYPNTTGPKSIGNLSVKNNDFQNIFAFQAVVMNVGFTGSWSGNDYNIPNNPRFSMIAAGTAQSVSQWAARYEPAAREVKIAYPDANRTVATYAGSNDAFLAGARSQSRQNWNSRYFASSAISYLKGGYGMSGGSSSVPSPTPTPTPSASPTPTPTATPKPSPTPTPTSTANPQAIVWDAKTTEGAAGTTTSLTFEVHLLTATTKTVSINWKTANQTAAGGTDFNVTTGTITIAPGKSVGYGTVVIHGDSAKEGNEIFQIQLTSAVNAVIGRAKSFITINNDD